MPPHAALPSRSSRRSASSGTGCWAGLLLPVLAMLFAGAGLLALNPPPAARPQRPPAEVIAPFFHPAVQAWSGDIAVWAEAQALDPNLAATVMQLESCGALRVSSPAGAAGLFQVMPFHFASGENRFDPQANAQRGLAYLREMLDLAQGDVGRALAAYNGGPGLLQRPVDSWPAESRRYSRWGAAVYADASGGLTHSVALEDWLASGGAVLCRKASRALGLD